MENTNRALRTLRDLQKHLKQLVAEDEFVKAFALFEQVFNDDSSVANTLISLQGQYNSNRKQQNQGTISDDFAARTFNRIRIALTDLADRLETEDLNPDFLQLAPGGNPGNVVSNLSAIERQGLLNQLDILQKKRNFLAEQLIIINDPTQKFTVQVQVEETDRQIQDTKTKLGIL